MPISAFPGGMAADADTESVPAGVIVLWCGILAAIPAGWLLCDGTNGTPDLRALFIRGAADGAEPGDTGGAPTHIPTGSVSAPDFTGEAATSTATSAGTPAGTNSAPSFAGDAVTSTATSAGTPSGGVSAPTFTGSPAGSSAVSAGTPAGAVSQPTFTGDALGTHTHTYTQVPNHVHVQSVNSAATGGLSGYTADTSTNNSVASGYSTANPTGGVVTATTNATGAGTPAGTVSQPIFTGSSLGTHTHTVTAAGTNSAPTFTGDALATHTHVVTATGTVSAPAFTGDALATHTHDVTAAGTNSAPTFTGDAASYDPAYRTVAFIMKAAA